MRKRRGISILAALAALLLTAPAAPAATEVGWDCTANDTEASLTVLATSGLNLPMADYVPPEGPKVITGWRVKVGPGLGPLPQRLDVFEIKNENMEYEKIGESATETLVEGTNLFPTRIPADEGDSVGLYGPAGTLICREAGAISRLFEGSVAVGEVKPLKPVGEGGTPLEIGTSLVVTVEDDVDGDGYGDETQDRCPALAGFHEACPDLNFTVRKAGVKRGAILLDAEIEPTLPLLDVARTTANGGTSWPKAEGGNPKNVTRVDLSSGVRTLTPGVPARLRIPLPKRVTRKLATMKPSKFIKAEFVVEVIRGYALSGSLAKRHVIVRLHGRGKPVQHGA